MSIAEAPPTPPTPSALMTCGDCGHGVSPSASACPNCGKPLKPKCPHCGVDAVEKAEGLQGGKEVVIGLVLFACLLLPGLAYYFDRQSFPYCTACKRRVPKAVLRGA